MPRSEPGVTGDRMMEAWMDLDPSAVLEDAEVGKLESGICGVPCTARLSPSVMGAD